MDETTPIVVRVGIWGDATTRKCVVGCISIPSYKQLCGAYTSHALREAEVDVKNNNNKLCGA